MNTNNNLLLIVDDNAMNRGMLSRRLNKAGFETHTACDGQQALDMINETNYDLVLLDVMMPNLNGYQDLEELSKTSKLSDLSVTMIIAHTMR